MRRVRKPTRSDGTHNLVEFGKVLDVNIGRYQARHLLRVDEESEGVRGKITPRRRSILRQVGEA